MGWYWWLTVAIWLLTASMLLWYWLQGSRSRQDLKPVGLAVLPDKASTTELDDAAILVLDKAEKSAAWYRDARRSKRTFAMAFRFCAIILTVMSGLMPVLTQIFWPGQSRTVLWASIMLGAAGLFVALDRFGDLSRGWVRYVIASTRITSMTDAFLLEWRAFRAEWPAAGPSTEHRDQGYAKCLAFLNAVNTIVAEETSVWAAEFQSAIQQLDADLDRARAARATAEVAELREIKEREAAAQPGALNVSIPDAPKLDGEWTLVIDERKYAGTSNSFGCQAGPGLVRMELSGVIQGKPVGVSRVVEVSSGKIVDVELKLAT